MNALDILVTGATSGIGRQTALDLARAGHRVFASGRRADALKSLADAARGTKLETVVMDVTKDESIAAARAQILAATGGRGLDALVNNAGYGAVGPLEEITDAALRAQYDTNVFGLMAVTRAFLPEMRARSFGRIVNVSSIGGRMTFPLMGAYNSTKYAVESLSDALRIELKPFGVRVSIIEPGSIKTEFADVALGTAPEANGSPYAGAMAEAEAIRQKFDAAAVGPEVISRAIQKAIESKNPSARYVAPFSGRVMLFLARTLPTSWFDALLGSMSGLTKAKLLPKAGGLATA
ncbi:MAG TPA: SDR family oxidoreductase [Polyangiaceae bacterium]|nr:SDR family oxidoreductase [Polyangiaceae bacterium]